MLIEDASSRNLRRRSSASQISNAARVAETNDYSADGASITELLGIADKRMLRRTTALDSRTSGNYRRVACDTPNKASV